MFLKKVFLKLCSKFTGEHPCRSGTSMKLQSNLLKLHFGMRVFAVNLLYIFRTPFPKNSSGWLLVADGGHWHRGNGDIKFLVSHVVNPQNYMIKRPWDFMGKSLSRQVIILSRLVAAGIAKVKKCF